MVDIAAVVGIRAPSLYNHVDSKQQLLAEIMQNTMETLTADLHDALSSTEDPVEQLRRATEAHIRWHARHPREMRVGNSEIRALQEPKRSQITQMRREYADAWERLIALGVDRGLFRVPAPRLAVFAILEMGMGVSMWFRQDGPMSEALIAYHYADMALRLVGADAATLATPAIAPARG